MKKKTIIWGIVIIVGLVILGVAWWLISPLFLNTVVNEEMPELIEAQTLYSGGFVDADSFHQVSGQATVISDGSMEILRLSDFDSTNGPDLKVYLATDLEASDYVSLGALKGNIGNQNYDIPDGTDLERYDNVLIWCEAFSTLFGSAELS